MAKIIEAKGPDGKLVKFIALQSGGEAEWYPLQGEGSERKIEVNGRPVEYPEYIPPTKAKTGGPSYTDAREKREGALELVDTFKREGPTAFDQRYDARYGDSFTWDSSKGFGIGSGGIETPIGGRFPIMMGETASKMSSGILDKADQLKRGVNAIASMLGPEGTGDILADKYKKRLSGRASERQVADKSMEQFNKEVGMVERTLADMPIYMATGIAGTKPAEALASIAGGVFKRIPFGTMAPVKAISLKNPWMTKAEKIRRKQKEVPYKSTYHPGAMKRAGGATILGAGESELMGEKPLEGALSSLIGQQAGKRISKYTSKEPNQNALPDQNLIEWGKEEVGYTPSPGRDYGNLAWQGQEAGYRADAKTSHIMKAFDESNDAKFNKKLMETIGMDPDSVQDLRAIDADAMRNHLAKMGKEFDELEANSALDFTVDDYRALEGIADSIPKTSTGKEQASDLTTMIKDLMVETRAKPSVTGAPTTKIFSGKQYKDHRSKLVEARNSAMAAGESDQSRRINQVVKLLDDKMKKSVTTNKGEQFGERWADLRERFALGKTLVDTSINQGKVDLASYGRMINKGGHRDVTGEGSERIQNLNKLIDLEYGESGQRGTLMSGSDIGKDAGDAGRKTEAKAWVMPGTDRPGATQESKLLHYLSGRKAKGIGLPTGGRIEEGLMRALQQTHDPYAASGMAAFDFAKETAKDPKGKAFSLIDLIQDEYAKYKEDEYAKYKEDQYNESNWNNK